jgi:hypothetical protein
VRSGRDLASQIAAASTGSFLLRLTYGFTCAGGSNRTSCPSAISACPPMVRRRARLHRHHAWRQLGEEQDQLAAREFARHNDLAPRIDCVNLKHPLRQIETNPRDSPQIPDRLAHGELPFRWGFDNDHLGTLMPFGAPSTSSFADGAANGSIDPKSDVRNCAARARGTELFGALQGNC